LRTPCTLIRLSPWWKVLLILHLLSLPLRRLRARHPERKAWWRHYGRNPEPSHRTAQTQ